ncbi:MAG: gliding motility-associated C-terminal domain-containing protein [Bacteroidia bacterium]
MLKKIALTLVFQLLISCTYAQIIKDGVVFGGNGNQQLMQCFVDKADCKYLVITYNNDFIIDSSGFPVIIQKNYFAKSNNPNNSIVIIKIDKKGKYLFHIRIVPSYSDYGAYLDLKFDQNNDVLLCYNFSQSDTVDLFNANGQFFKKIIPTYVRKTNDGNYYATLVCKLTSNGIFIWANVICQKHLKSSFSQTHFNNYINLNKNNEVIFLFIYNTLLNNDTISVTNNFNQTNDYLISTSYILFKFNANGDLIKVKEPFKNCLKSNNLNFFSTLRLDNFITDGENYYVTPTFTLISADSFKYRNTYIPLNIGYYHILVKLDNSDSIIWAKPIARNKQNLFFMGNIRLDVNKLGDEILLGFTNNHLHFENLIDTNLINNTDGYYFVRIDTNGNKIKDNIYPDSWFVSATYNQINNKINVIGFTNGNDTSISKYLPLNPLNGWMPFIAYLDTNFKIQTAQAFKNNYDLMSSSIFMNSTKIGYPITDSKGQTYIPGWFADSIGLPCQTLRATIQTNQWGNYLNDGFLLQTSPFISKDTIVCKNLLSPSGKYIWDSSRTYTDTLKNTLGCDSIVFYNVKVLRSKSVIDTIVCEPIKSISGRYKWDSTGTYFDTIPNTFGCDSIITVNLVIKANKLTIDTTVKYNLVSPSKKYIWDSIGTFADTLINRHGCDSIIIFKLKVLSTKNSIDTFNCNPIQYISKREWISNSGIYYDTIANSIGGDSLLTIRFVLGSSQSLIDTMYCSEIKSISGRFVWKQTGIYKDTIFNHLFCDSVITVKFIRTGTTDSLKIEQCDSLLLPSGKLKVGNTGMYLDTLTTKNGCDSILIINYTNLSSYSELTIAICDSLISPSGKFIYKTSGIFTDTLINNKGCDSLIKINIQKTDKSLAVTKSNDIDCNNPFTILNAQGGINYQWIPIEGLSDASSRSPIASPKNSTTYYVIATDTLGCEMTDSIYIHVNLTDSLGFMPNVITPNGDKKNDCLPLNSITEFKKINFMVLNRWGNIVFETAETTLCWEGKTNNGQELSEGVYFYMLKGITQCGENLSLHGTITIIR